LVVALAACGAPWLGCEPTLEEKTTQAPLSSATCAGYPTVWDLKSQVGLSGIATDETLRDCYWLLLADAYGVNPNQYKLDFDSALPAHPLAGVLTQDQVTAWRELNNLTRGHFRVSWGLSTHTPEHLEVGLQLQGAVGSAALTDLQTRTGNILPRMFGMGNTDKLVLVDQRTHQAPAQSPQASLYHVLYRREHTNLPVFQDSFSIYLRTSDWSSSAWVAIIRAHWASDLQAVNPLPVISAADAVNAAVLSGEVPNGAPEKPPVLGYYTLPKPSELAYEVRLANTAGKHWLYYVSAASGSILAASSQVANDYSGALNAYVVRPYEGNTLNWRPLPYAKIYEDPYFGPAQTCTGTSGNQTYGDPQKHLGTTDLNGEYYGLNPDPGDPNDDQWVIDYRGTYVFDVDYFRNDLTEAFTAGGVDYFSGTHSQNHPRRRRQAFYNLNWAAHMYREVPYPAEIPQYVPLRFYDNGSSLDPVCQDPLYADPWSCCGGSSLFGGCMEFFCDLGDEIGSAPTERRFRSVVYHEFNHHLRYKQAGNLCYTCRSRSETRPLRAKK